MFQRAAGKSSNSFMADRRKGHRSRGGVEWSGVVGIMSENTRTRNNIPPRFHSENINPDLSGLKNTAEWDVKLFY